MVYDEMKYVNDEEVNEEVNDTLNEFEIADDVYEQAAKPVINEEELPYEVESKEEEISPKKRGRQPNKKELLDDLKKSIDTDYQTMFDAEIDDKLDIDTLTEKPVISTGIDLIDAIFGGGLRLGSFSVFVGNPGGGKSTLAAAVMKNMQLKYGNQCLSLYLDSEQTMTQYRLKQLGLPNPIKPKVGITIEKVFETIEAIVMYKKEKNLIDLPTLVIWDSIANTPSNKDLTANDVNETIGLKARILSMNLPKIIDRLREYNILLIAINQLRDKLQMGMFQTAADLKYLDSDKTMPGGKSIEFNASTLINIRHKSDIKVEQYGFYGGRMLLKTVKNKFFTPNISVDLVLDFKTGFSNFWSNYVFMSENKYIKTGAWNSLESLPEKKFRTKDVLELYNSDEEFKSAFDELSNKAIKELIYDKYA